MIIPYTIIPSLFSKHYALYTILSTIYFIHYTFFNIHYALYTILSAEYTQHPLDRFVLSRSPTQPKTQEANNLSKLIPKRGLQTTTTESIQEAKQLEGYLHKVKTSTSPKNLPQEKYQ